jgi:hypothetical protein
MALSTSLASSSSGDDQELLKIISLNLFIYTMELSMLSLIDKTQIKMKIAKTQLS